MASRILGMGDVLTLIEKAESQLDEEKAREMTQKFKKAQFDFEDYLESMNQMRNLGGLSGIMSMMPGLGGMSAKMPEFDEQEGEKKMARMEAMIYSMTLEERRNPDILTPSRKHRIAKGAGVDIAEVNRMVKQFNEAKKMMKKLPGMMGGVGGKKGKFKLPF
jgi:signal recognition particle subunit SRP54